MYLTTWWIIEAHIYMIECRFCQEIAILKHLLVLESMWTVQTNELWTNGRSLILGISVSLFYGIRWRKIRSSAWLPETRFITEKHAIETFYVQKHTSPPWTSLNMLLKIVQGRVCWWKNAFKWNHHEQLLN